MSRCTQDIELLKVAFTNIIVGNNYEYFILPAFRLPCNVFDRETTRLLVIAPPTYATAPPDNFHVTWGLALRDGRTINNYSGPVDLYSEKWGTFSFHPDGGWNPQVDSFFTFLTAIQNRLQEGA